MSQTNQFNRQTAKHIVVELTKANIGAGNEVTAKLPQGALLLSITYYVDTAFDSATTTTGTVSDGTTTYVNAVNAKTTGSKTVANAPSYYPNGGTLTFSMAETGATATVGHAVASVAYVQPGNGNSVQG